MLKAVILIGGPQKGKKYILSPVFSQPAVFGQSKAKLLKLTEQLSLLICVTDVALMRQRHKRPTFLECVVIYFIYSM